MRRVWVFVTVFLMTTVCVVAEDDPLASLSWISGTWAGTSGNVSMEEYWTQPGGGLLVGLHRDVFDGGRSFFEYLRIEQRADDIVFVAMPRGEKATDFHLTEQIDNKVVFENPEHDFPTKIIYERDGDTLIATIEGLANGEIRSKSWRWQRVTPAE